MTKKYHFNKKIYWQAGGGAAANVNCLNLETVALNFSRRRVNIPRQNFHKLGNFFVARQNIRREGTVKTTRHAKRNANVNADSFFVAGI